MPWLTRWAPRDARALIALAASIGGAAVLTGFAGWLVWILWRGGWPPATSPERIAALARALLASLAIIGAVLLSLGLAINRRSLHARAFGASLEASGGDEAPGAAPVVTVACPVAGESADGRDNANGQDSANG